MRWSKALVSGRVGRTMTDPMSPSTSIGIALVGDVADVGDAPDHRHAHRAGDDGDVGGQRPFLQHHALQPPPVIFEQLGRPEVAGDEDRVLGKPGLRGGAHPARHDPHQAVRQVLQVVHPLFQKRIVDVLHPGAGALLDPLDRRLGGQAAVDRLVDPPRPALVIGEHLVGLEDLIVLAGRAELGLAGHIVDLLAHPAEGGIDPGALGLGVLGDGMLDHDPRLVEDGDALGHAGDELQPDQPLHPRIAPPGPRPVDQPRAGDQLGQHHRDGLQRLDLDIVVAARLGMLDGEHADRLLAADDGDAREAVELSSPVSGR